jgi:hypothetical protein
MYASCTSIKLLPSLIEGLGLVGVLSYFLIFGWLKPSFNWDLLPYTALALENNSELSSELSKDELHRRTYKEAEKIIPPLKFTELILPEKNFGHELGSGYYEYRPRMAKSAAMFYAQLPFYRMRVLYTSFLKTHTFFNLDVITFSRLLSLLGMTGIILVLHLWWRNFLLPLITPIMILYLGQTLDFRYLASLSNPDTLAIFLQLLGAYLFFSGCKLPFIIAPLFLTLFLRTDSLFLSIFILAAWWFRERKIYIVIPLLIFPITVYLLHTLTGHPGWWHLYYHQFIAYLPGANSVTPPFSLFLYLKTLKGLFSTLLNEPWAKMLGGSIPIYLTLLNRFRFKGGDLGLLFFTVGSGTLLLNLLLFPAGWSRLHCSAIILILTSSLHALPRAQVYASKVL